MLVQQRVHPTKKTEMEAHIMVLFKDERFPFQRNGFFGVQRWFWPGGCIQNPK